MGGKRARVLVADDHQPVLDRIVALLADEFAVIGAVTDGVQLVAAEAALQPDVVVVDICMPAMGGLEATAAIRRRGSQIPVVCVSSFDVSDFIDAALEAGVTGFVAKTSLVHDLVPAIRAALDGRRFVSARSDAVGPRST